MNLKGNVLIITLILMEKIILHHEMNKIYTYILAVLTVLFALYTTHVLSLFSLVNYLLLLFLILA